MCSGAISACSPTRRWSLAEELADSAHVGQVGVLVPDGGGEEFEEAAGGMFASLGNQTRHPWVVTRSNNQIRLDFQ